MQPDYAPLFYWVREREQIRIRKETGAPQPWTLDPILGEWRFCNVRREDDLVTVWVRDNIRKPYAGHPYLWLMLCLARQINWPETLTEMIDFKRWPEDESFDPAGITELLNSRKNAGQKIYTGAYMISYVAGRGY